MPNVLTIPANLQGRQVEDQSFNPFVSVILAVYQGETVVCNAVRSVLKQTYDHLELIVVDDGSQDRTVAVLKHIQDPRLKIVTQPNKGTAAARNRGLAQAAGDYIGFIDADDVWLPHKLAVELEALERSDGDADIVYSWYYAVDDAGRLVNLSPSYREAGNIFDTVLSKESVLLPSTTLFHRKVFERLGGFPEEIYHEDRAFSIKACKYFQAIPTTKRLVIYRQSESGKCRSILNDFDTALELQLSVVDGLKGDLWPFEVRRLLAIETRNLFYRFLMYNHIRSARALYSQVDRTLMRDKKGMLARISMVSGVNLLYYSRLFVQYLTRSLLSPVWRWQLSTALFYFD